MRILITGSSGFLGTALRLAFAAGGHTIVRLVRREARAADEAAWDPAAGRLDADAVAGADAVVHLAGESIAGGRWNAARKARIRDSRVQGTRLLSQALARLERRPRVLVCASAAGYYGDRGDELLREDSAPGSGFLPELCRAWEAAADAARAAGVRVVHLRTGIVLAAHDGALARMLWPFRLGLGGPLGSGRQYMSWITLDDLVGVVERVLADETFSGAVNAVAPEPVTNAAFTAALARALSRPAFARLPAFVVRLLLGEMGDALLLASARMEPARLVAAHHRFQHPSLESALRHVLRPGGRA